MIVVVGATGSTGGWTVRELQQRGLSVRATARDLPRARAQHEALGIDTSKVEYVFCDLEREESIPAALAGADKCYVAVGGPTGTPKLVDVEKRFIDHAQRAGVRHYVKVSGINARPSGSSKIEQMHGAIAEYLLASKIPATVLEPSFFMQNFLGLAPAIKSGVLPLPTGDARAGLIDAHDIARCAAVVLASDDSTHAGARYVLTGPALLSHEEAATVMAGVLEHPVQFVNVPTQAFEQSLCDAGLPPWFANLLADVYGTFFSSGRAAIVTDTVEQLTGQKPTSLATFLRRHRAAFG